MIGWSAAATAALAAVACAVVAASDASRPYVPLNSLTIASLYTNRTERIDGGESEKGVRSSDQVQVTAHSDQVNQFSGDQVTQYDGGDQVQKFSAEEEEVEWFQAAEAASRASRDGEDGETAVKSRACNYRGKQNRSLENST